MDDIKRQIENKINGEILTEFYNACGFFNDPDLVRSLVRRNPWLLEDVQAVLAFNAACYYNNLETVKLLCERGVLAKVDLEHVVYLSKKDKNNSTVLEYLQGAGYVA